MRRATLLAVLAAGLVLSSAAAAQVGAAGATGAPRPDSHDRALVMRLGAKVTTFRTLAEKRSNGKDLQASLDNCAELEKDPTKAFAAVFALLPVLVIDLVNTYGAQLTDLHDTLAGMDADEPLFDRWLQAQVGTFASILALDNHGKKIDYCKAATVMLDKHATAKEIRGALGVDASAIVTLFAPSSASSTAALKRLNLKMRAFFVAGGLSPTIANALTS